MPLRFLFRLFLLCWIPIFSSQLPAQQWTGEVEARLKLAGENRAQLEKALTSVPEEQRRGMEFLVINMPDTDLENLTAEFLLENHRLAYEARTEVPWGSQIPEELFFNHVLPYANMDESRDPWRKELSDLCRPLIRDCKTPSAAAIRLNSELFGKLQVKYAPQRRAPNLSPRETMRQGNASCTGLSILLSDACRAVCIPTRVVGTPNWSDKRGNHTWLEIWDQDWHFTGACEQDPQGLDRGWFVGDAARAIRDSPEHAIYATSFRRTALHFPLVWDRESTAVSAENITDRYARTMEPSDKARVGIRVTNDAGQRVVVAVSLLNADGVMVQTGFSKGEAADLNDFLTASLPPGEYTAAIGPQQTKFTVLQQDELQVIDIRRPPLDSVAALTELTMILAQPREDLRELQQLDLADVPLSESDALAARKLLISAYQDLIRRQRAQEVTDRILKDGELEMKFAFTVSGDAPREGRSLWISLHGGGGAPAEVNDRQWENQKRLYEPEEGIYLAPRAPTNTWNLWHEPHIDRLFARLIEDLIAIENVNPNRVYVMGYSAGGDGVYQIGPRMADHWAGAAMMAGHPNGVSLLSLRNCPFALQVGANDSAYDRNRVGREYGDELARLRQADPEGYRHFVKIHEGKGHWMNLEDKAAIPWLAELPRNPLPDRVVWKQTGTPHDRFYWLAVPAESAKVDSLVTARRRGQTIDIETADQVDNLRVRLDDRMVDLDQPVIMTHAGRELFRGIAPRTIRTLLRTLIGRGDPELVFCAEISVALNQ